MHAGHSVLVFSALKWLLKPITKIVSWSTIMMSWYMVDDYMAYLYCIVMNCDLVRDTVPGSPPQNVRARPVSSNTVVVQWDEPKLSNGVIRVQISLFLCRVYT